MAENLIQENIALAPLTTLQVGGAARFFVEATTENEILTALNFAKNNNLPIFVLGGGSNVLISDAGFNGLVIKIALRGIEFSAEKDDVFVTAGAGENWDEFVKICVEKNLAGVECLSGIPGTTGATPVQNVGAYGQEVSETIFSVRILDRENLEISDLNNADCKFEYRTSIFNTTHKNKFVVLSVTFRLKPGGKPTFNYPDLQRFFTENPTLAQVRATVLQIRAAKSMVILPNDENRRSAGSFFKNPFVGEEKLARIEATARILRLISALETVPHFPTDEDIKISAAWLIEKTGFEKGFTRGRVGLSTRHTLAVINRGGATAAEIVELVGVIQDCVSERFGVRLQPEPVFVGFEK